MNDIIVFCVGAVVSAFVVYGVFTQVVSEMYRARSPEKSESQTDKD